MENINATDAYQPIQVGMREQSKIKEIHKGKATEFYGEKYWDNFKQGKDETEEDFGQRLQHAKDQSAIEILADNGASVILTLPEGTLYHPKSKLATFVKMYGSLPVIGLPVFTEFNVNGFRKIVV